MVMKNVFFAFIVLVLAACGTQKQLQIKAVDAEAADDSVSYELIVLDPGFESWFVAHSKPDWYHSQDYYENWNRQYVTAWNHKSMWTRYSQLLDGQINYETDVDYGLEINHKLFYYFQYVENVLHIPIISNGPVAI